MVRRSALAALLALAPLTAAAQETPVTRGEAQVLTRLVEAAGCTVAWADAGEVLGEEMTVERARVVAAALRKAGQAAVTGARESLTLLTPACVPEDETARFATLIEGEGCELAWRDAGRVLGGAGFPADLARAVVRDLVDARKGEILRRQGQEVFRLLNDACLDPEKRAVFETELRARGCRIEGNEVRDIFVPLGFTEGEVKAAARSLRDAGLAKLDGNAMVLLDETCG